MIEKMSVFEILQSLKAREAEKELKGIL